jgi:hypothetical protein
VIPKSSTSAPSSRSCAFPILRSVGYEKVRLAASSFAEAAAA